MVGLHTGFHTHNLNSLHESRLRACNVPQQRDDITSTFAACRLRRESTTGLGDHFDDRR